MRQKVLCLLGLVVCATMISACGEEEKRPHAAVAVRRHALLNGTDDSSEAHHAVVALYQKGAERVRGCGKDKIFCTGTLIHPQWVLTAAHCVAEFSNFAPYATKPSICNDYVSIGVGNNEEEATRTLYTIASTAQIYYHDNFGVYIQDELYNTITSDIALIKLAVPVPESIAVPILPHPPWLRVESGDLAKDMEFVGFGVNETGGYGTKLRFTGSISKYCSSADDPGSSNGCENGYVIVDGCHPLPEYCEKDGYIDKELEYVLMPNGSFYYDQKVGGPCQGDSGGPLFDTIGGKEYVSGITSFGDAICMNYGISTAVQDYYDWIVSIAPEVADQYKEICDNGVDDDGDGKTDDDDPDCHVSDCPDADSDCPDADSENKETDSGHSNCQANVMMPGAGSLAAILMGLLGLVSLIRRRRERG